uniref:BLOC-1-related complex subunit 5 n=1 Tax=Gongylonema pulchrum TaxID=637853 RepID=A0A183CZY9_9BILA
LKIEPENTGTRITDESTGTTAGASTNGTAIDSDNTDMSASLTLRINNNGSNSIIGYKYESGKKMERIVEEEEKQKSTEWDQKRGDQEFYNGYSTMNARDPMVRVQSATPTRNNSVFTNSSYANGTDSLQRISSRNEISAQKFIEEIPPVQVLQLVLKQFTFKEKLNSAYYELTKKADKLLTDCQRRVHSEPRLHDALAILTSVQVHILNPVDVLRAAMDEGL